MSNMKQDWEKSALKDACLFFTDGNWIESKDQSTDGIRLVQTGNIGFGFYKDKKDNARFISEETFNRLKCTEILPNDLLVSRLPDPVGKSCIIPDINSKMITGVDCTIIRTKDNLKSEFLLYYQMSNQYLSDVKSRVTGTTRSRISRKNLGLIEIPLPPLPEQQRIVAVLDKIFAAIAKAKANAEQNLENARKLFESYLQGVFEDKGEDWEEKKLGKIAKVIGGYSFKSKDFEKQGKFQVIRMGNVRPGIIREKESPVFISNMEDKVLERALLLSNDVIITQTGTKNKRDYGFTVIIDKDNYLLNQRISSIRFSNNYLPKFFLYFSWTNHFKDQYFANETGTVGQGNVGIKAITDAIVPFLSISEQQIIIKKLDSLSAETKKLEAIYQKKMEDLEELKKIVLQKAFNGEL